MSNAIQLRQEETDLVALLSSRLAPLAKHAARENVDLRVEAAGELPAISVDRNQLAWCVATLAGTALRCVRGAHHIEPAARIVVRVARDSSIPNTVGISISDDGPGIPQGSELPAFEPQAGVVHTDGLAMSLICEIVAAHGGQVEVKATRGREAHGTTVTLRLPFPSA